MSTLTKVLIVLLTVFSLFLSGIVVTYVANAENYRKTASDTERRLRAATETRDNAVRISEEKNAEVESTKADLGSKLADRDTQIAKFQGDLDAAKRLNAELQQKVASMADVMANASAAVKQQTALHEAAQQRVQALEAEQINQKKELTETSQALLEKATIIAQLNDKVRQLTQENQELGNRLNQYLVKYGRMSAQPTTTVLPGTPTARPAQPIASYAPIRETKQLDLNGRVTNVDLQNRWVEISIGSAAGVRQDALFHLIRGDQYVADIQIVEVWPDRAVGVLSLLKTGMRPQTGDRVTTNL